MAAKFKTTLANAATDVEFFGDVGAQETLAMAAVHVAVTTGNAGDKIVLEDESGNNDFLSVDLTTVGNYWFVFPEDARPHLPKGKDVLVTMTGSTARFDLSIYAHSVTGPTFT